MHRLSKLKENAALTLKCGVKHLCRFWFDNPSFLKGKQYCFTAHDLSAWAKPTLIKQIDEHESNASFMALPWGTLLLKSP